MSRTVRPRRLAVVSASAAAAVLALSGCAAGMISQTAQQVAAIDGANGDVGDISVLNVRFAQPEGEDKGYASGDDVRLLLYVSNNGLQPDTLAEVTSPAVASYAVDGSEAQAELPPQTLVDMGTDSGIRVELSLAEDVGYGQTVPVTFQFAQAGPVTVNVPIEVPSDRVGERERAELEPPHPTPLWETEPPHQPEVGEESGGAPETLTAVSPAQSTDSEPDQGPGGGGGNSGNS